MYNANKRKKPNYYHTTILMDLAWKKVDRGGKRSRSRGVTTLFSPTMPGISQKTSFETLLMRTNRALCGNGDVTTITIARAGHASAWDEERSGMWLYGGYTTFYPYISSDGAGSGFGTAASS